MRHDCIVPGCSNPGRHALTLRMRRPDTSAVWAPNTQAYFCDEHADCGAEVDILVRPNDTRRVETYSWAEVSGKPGIVERSTTEIVASAAERKTPSASPTEPRRRIRRPRG